MSTTKQQQTELTTLYDLDYYQWLITTAKLLRSGKLSEVDLDNLAEEIEDMGRSEKRATESNLVVILLHLLKCKYQPNKRRGHARWGFPICVRCPCSSWEYSIAEHRRRILKLFKDSPSLKKYFQEVFAECYQDGREQAAIETRLSIDTFPEDCPFTQEEVLDKKFLPKNENSPK